MLLMKAVCDRLTGARPDDAARQAGAMAIDKEKSL
jgi:hypothetical protein